MWTPAFLGGKHKRSINKDQTLFHGFGVQVISGWKILLIRPSASQQLEKRMIEWYKTDKYNTRTGETHKQQSQRWWWWWWHTLKLWSTHRIASLFWVVVSATSDRPHVVSSHFRRRLPMRQCRQRRRREKWKMTRTTPGDWWIISLSKLRGFFWICARNL